MNLLVLIAEPEQSGLRLERLGTLFPGLVVHVARSVDEAMPLIGAVDILITLPPHLGSQAAQLFAAATRLTWVQLVTTGSDNVREYLEGSTVVLTSARGLHGHQMSEAAIAAMLGLARQVPRLLRNQQDQRWQRFPAQLLNGKTAAIIGLGAIAETLAPMLKIFGMHVVGYSGSSRPVAGFDEVRVRSTLAATVGDVDHLIVLAPLSLDTAGLVDGAVFAGMKPSAFLINLARGGIVDEAALLDALNRDALAGAALDVFATEPLPADNPLWRHPHIIVTPHAGGLHDGYQRDILDLAVENLRHFLAGEPLRNPIDLSPRRALQ